VQEVVHNSIEVQILNQMYNKQ